MAETKLDPDQILRAAVNMVAKSLTDDELASINIAMQLKQDPRGVIGYEKVKHLFTAQAQVEDPFTHTSEVIPVAHQATQEAFEGIVLKRLPPATPPIGSQKRSNPLNKLHFQLHPQSLGQPA